MKDYIQSVVDKFFKAKWKEIYSDDSKKAPFKVDEANAIDSFEENLKKISNKDGIWVL